MEQVFFLEKLSGKILDEIFSTRSGFLPTLHASALPNNGRLSDFKHKNFRLNLKEIERP